MLLRDDDTAVFKQWLLPKLETISDADAEVLADYVIALVTTNDTEANIRQNCIESLSDFLQDNTQRFVDDVVKALRTKAYVARPSTNKTNGARSNANETASQPIPSIVDSSAAENKPRPSYPTNTPPAGAPTGPAATRTTKTQHYLPGRHNGPSPANGKPEGPQNQETKQQSSRKRKLVQRDTSEPREGLDSHYNRSNATGRQSKHVARKGGRHAGVGNDELELQNGSFGGLPMSNMSNFPPPPPGPPPFDMSNPMALMAMMAAFGATMPGMPSLPSLTIAPNLTGNHGRTTKCSDYHTKGFCAAGNMCPYEHDIANATNQSVPEYDPTQPISGFQENLFTSGLQGSLKVHGRSAKGARRRASFSLPGPSYDRSNTTLVIEQIPPESCNEDDVRGFFAEFGTIADIRMHSYKRLAIVKYEDHSSANRAYNSPKAVFENRFVKVYWHKTESNGGNEVVEMDDGREVLDLEEIEKRQAAAQKAFEERRKKQEEADARAADIERQLKEKDEEMRKIKRQLAALAAGENVDFNEEEYSQTLATLQAEAENLFAQNDSTLPAGVGRGFTPRGGYRGRESDLYAPRGRGYPPRGAHRVRGAFAGPLRGVRSGVKRLDNRPKRLAVAGIVKNSQKEEALRQYLVPKNMPECTSIEQHPEHPNTLILTFQERYQAESFLDNSRSIADINGPLELSWVPSGAFSSLSSTAAEPEAEDSGNESSATVGDRDKVGNRDADDVDHAADADMDVADDVDQWL